jgi:ketosteroid isomerase-like protein
MNDKDNDLSVEKTRLLTRDAEWAAAASEGRDVECILSYWTDDAVVLPPGLPPIIGKIALREYVETSLQIPGFKITWTSGDAIFSPDRQLAYVFSQNTVTRNGPDGRAASTKGRAVTIWRLEPDGEWRCAVDIWNAEPAT